MAPVTASGQPRGAFPDPERAQKRTLRGVAEGAARRICCRSQRREIDMRGQIGHAGLALQSRQVQSRHPRAQAEQRHPCPAAKLQHARALSCGTGGGQHHRVGAGAIAARGLAQDQPPAQEGIVPDHPMPWSRRMAVAMK